MNREHNVVTAVDVSPRSSDEFLALLSKWKGANGNLLFVLMFKGQGLTAVELEHALRYTDKPVRQMLREMEEAGLVEHHGRAQGWTMTQIGRIKIMRWFAAGGSEKLRSADADQVWSDSDLSSESESDLTEDKDNYQSGLTKSDLIRSDLRQTSPKNDGARPEESTLLVEGAAKKGNRQGEREAMRTFLALIEIDGQALSEILVRDRLVDVVAWYWFTLGKPNIQKPSGWVVACLRNETKPQPAYLESARVWLEMSEEDYADYLEAKNYHKGAFDYWVEREVSEEAVEVFDRVRRHGGLDLFENFDRPILAKEELTEKSL